MISVNEQLGQIQSSFEYQWEIPLKNFKKIFFNEKFYFILFFLHKINSKKFPVHFLAL